jgi:hypothetical protein
MTLARNGCGTRVAQTTRGWRGAAYRSVCWPWRTKNMLWTIFVLLLVLWLLGMVSSYTLGGFIHLLLVLAVAVVLINIIQGRRAI